MQPFDMPQFQAGLARLRERFLAELPTRLEVIQQALAHASEVSSPSSTLLDSLHRLAGAAGSLGFTTLSEAARHLEKQVQDSGADPARLAELCKLAAQLGDASKASGTAPHNQPAETLPPVESCKAGHRAPGSP